MRVYKFGGASIRSADAIRNLVQILGKRPPGATVVIVSAMDKNTNAFEELARLWFDGDSAMHAKFHSIMGFHQDIVMQLFDEGSAVLEPWRSEIQLLLESSPSHNFDETYDSVVQYGELLSAAIIGAYLEKEGMEPRCLDARKLIITDEQFRDATVDWKATNLAIRSTLHKENKYNQGLILSQGFIAASERGKPSTLGREGSDYSAAIFAYALDAEELVIWKDVPGLLNADPKFFSQTVLLPAISYREAIELAYYGASIIHPKTIKPLENKQIPLIIKSFINPEGEGSRICATSEDDSRIPSFIHKQDQILLTLSPRDFSFMDEKVLAEILKVFADEKLKLNLMQNSAITFSACFDRNDFKFKRVLDRLSANFRMRYNEGLGLITIRHYTEDAIAKLLFGKEVLLEQRSRSTAQFVAKG